MRLLVFVLLLPCTLFAQFPIDVEHYRFHIDLNDQNDTIYGRAEIRVRFNNPAEAVEFNLVQDAGNGKGMQPISATGPNVRGLMKLRNENKIRIPLTSATRINDTATYTIHYKGIPADGLIISKTKYGKRSFFADNWPDRGQNWLPCHDHPADKATVEFLVTAPGHYQVVANGIQMEESNLPGDKKFTHWVESVPISTKVMVIGVAEFAIQQSGTINDCIPVYSWIYPEDRNKGFSDYALAGKILPFFVDYIGPYPYRKLANVQSKTRFGGLENANTIFYSEGSVTGTGRSESLIAHEIAHQWFGNHATEKTFAHLWLSEGFATYMTILYFEQAYGKDTSLHMIREDRDEVIAYAKTSNRPVVDSTETDYMALLNPNSYEKGGWVLHMLRNELGDSLFKKAMRTYYSTYAGSVAGTEELRKVFEEVSGKKLETFFSQWLYTPGIPKLKITWKYNASEKQVSINIDQLQKSVFRFPIEFLAEGSGQKPFKLNITKKSESFTIPLTGKPSGLVADPNSVLLFEAVVQE